MPNFEQTGLQELQQRWQAIFSTLAQGGEVPPTTRLRAEGYMEALCSLGVATEAEMQAAMSDCYLSCFEVPLMDEWQTLFPFPQIPGFGQRAPVYPSTKD